MKYYLPLFIFIFIQNFYSQDQNGRYQGEFEWNPIVNYLRICVLAKQNLYQESLYDEFSDLSFKRGIYSGEYIKMKFLNLKDLRKDKEYSTGNFKGMSNKVNEIPDGKGVLRYTSSLGIGVLEGIWKSGLIDTGSLRFENFQRERKDYALTLNYCLKGSFHWNKLDCNPTLINGLIIDDVLDTINIRSKSKTQTTDIIINTYDGDRIEFMNVPFKNYLYKIGVSRNYVFRFCNSSKKCECIKDSFTIFLKNGNIFSGTYSLRHLEIFNYTWTNPLKVINLIAKSQEGKWVYANGEYYIGEHSYNFTEEGIRQGTGKEIIREGNGTYHFNNNNEYTGGWLNGTQHGKGTWLYPNGNKEECIYEKGILQNKSNSQNTNNSTASSNNKPIQNKGKTTIENKYDNIYITLKSEPDNYFEAIHIVNDKIEFRTLPKQKWDKYWPIYVNAEGDFFDTDNIKIGGFEGNDFYFYNGFALLDNKKILIKNENWNFKVLKNGIIITTLSPFHTFEFKNTGLNQYELLGDNKLIGNFNLGNLKLDKKAVVILISFLKNSLDY